MVDSSWDSQAPVPSSGRGPAWGKVLLGCGLAALLGGSVLVVGGMTLANQKLNSPQVQAEMRRSLGPLLRRLVDDLLNDEGARSVYARQRRLRSRFPNEEAFLTQVRAWRPSLATMPRDLEGAGAFESRFSFQGMRLTIRLGDGKHFVVLLQGRGKRTLPVRDLEVR